MPASAPATKILTGRLRNLLPRLHQVGARDRSLLLRLRRIGLRTECRIRCSAPGLAFWNSRMSGHDVAGRAAVRIDRTRSVGDQAAVDNEEAIRVAKARIESISRLISSLGIEATSAHRYSDGQSTYYNELESTPRSPPSKPSKPTVVRVL
jgi:hypothetical protein